MSTEERKIPDLPNGVDTAFKAVTRGFKSGKTLPYEFRKK
jgi:hypothetical protein